MAELAPELKEYARIINGLHANFEPHDGQVGVGRSLFNDECKDIFVEAGRNWGKTKFFSYCLWRYAQFYPGSENYYFSPYMTQTREILWAPRIMQDFGPFDWVHKFNDTEMRLTFKNGSFIKCGGSDNVESYRGVKPKGLTVLDEFKDFRPEFLVSYDPNRAANDSPLLIGGTPPDRHCQFSVVKEQHKNNARKRYFHAPTEQNPHIDKKRLEQKRLELIAAGEEDVWQREYMAMEVYGGKSKIFSMLDRTVIERHEDMILKLSKDRKKLEWIYFADPAAASVFGVLFAAFNPYSRELYLIDEIYESDQAAMTVKKIGQRIVDNKNDLEDRVQWREGYDEAATWFAAEMIENFSIGMEPSHKAANDKEHGLSLVKDLILQNKFHMSDRCVKLFWEMDNYYKDKKGKIPKTNDHLIDCLRYIVAALGYSFNEEKYIEPNVIDPNEDIFREKRRMLPQFKEDDYSSYERE